MREAVGGTMAWLGDRKTFWLEEDSDGDAGWELL